MLVPDIVLKFSMSSISDLIAFVVLVFCQPIRLGSESELKKMVACLG
jgi:hypothetical protein